MARKKLHSEEIAELTIEEELRYYKSALKDYHTLSSSTNKGLRHYFLIVHQIDFQQLKTIYGLYLDEKAPYEFWFKLDDLESRVKQLEKAILILEESAKSLA